MSEATEILSVHAFRRVARERERELQGLLDLSTDGSPASDIVLRDAGVPGWARGVRVQRAGLFQHAVVATEHRGH